MTKVRGQEVLDPANRIKGLTTIDEVTGCWNWTGAVRSPRQPYGSLCVGSRTTGTRKTVKAHRYSFEIFKGPIPPGMCGCHRCDNPRCVNPEHLFLGTKKDNADDRDRKGRNSPPPILRGSKGTNAKLTDAQVAEIRASSAPSRALAPRYGVSDSHVQALRRGKHFPAPPLCESASSKIGGDHG